MCPANEVEANLTTMIQLIDVLQHSLPWSAILWIWYLSHGGPLGHTLPSPAPPLPPHCTSILHLRVKAFDEALDDDSVCVSVSELRSVAQAILDSRKVGDIVETCTGFICRIDGSMSLAFTPPANMGSEWITLRELQRGGGGSGGTEKDSLARTKGAEDILARIAQQCLQGLEKLHKVGVLHGGVHPGSVLICPVQEPLGSGVLLTHPAKARAAKTKTLQDSVGSTSENAFRDFASLGRTLLQCYGSSTATGDAFVLKTPRDASPLFMSFVKQCVQEKHGRRPTAVKLLHHPLMPKNRRH